MSHDTSTRWRDRNVGEIAATLPGATRVFRAFKLDFCCGGDVPLASAAVARGVDVASIEAELDGLGPGSGPAAPDAGDALIDHILERYHDTHRSELPELVRLARRVEAVHAAHPDAPRGLAERLAHMQAELEGHMQKEELVLFPLMRQGGHPMIAQPIAQMRHEHDEHAEHLQALREITRDFTLPGDACRSWQALYVGTEKLVDDLMEHIHLENNILFSSFEGGSLQG